MNQEYLTQLLRSPQSETFVRTTHCPDHMELSAFVDNSLDDEDQQQVENHVASCHGCMRLVALASRLGASEPSHKTPELALARARRLGKKRKPTDIRRIGTWATAAVMLLALTIVTQWKNEPVPTIEAGPADPTVRTLANSVKPPEVLFPGAGLLVDAHDLEFRWTEITDSLYYDVYIVSDAGNLVWEERVTGTRWTGGDSLNLTPGMEYFVRVDAYLPNAKTLSSEHVAFTLSEP